jgi:hypothetical protein
MKLHNIHPQTQARVDDPSTFFLLTIRTHAASSDRLFGWLVLMAGAGSF